MFKKSAVDLNSAFYPYPAFYSQFAVCILRSVCILPLVRSLPFTRHKMRKKHVVAIVTSGRD